MYLASRLWKLKTRRSQVVKTRINKKLYDQTITGVHTTRLERNTIPSAMWLGYRSDETAERVHTRLREENIRATQIG